MPRRDGPVRNFGIRSGIAGRWRKQLSILGALAVCSFAAVSPSLAVGPARFVHLSVEQGLSQSTVHAIFQDHIGFMWFGTGEGLNRYDGYTITVFKHDPKNPGSLPSDKVWALQEDSKHRLWVGTDAGLCEFDRRTERFTAMKEIRGKVTAIFEDPTGALWVGVEGYGLFMRDPISGIFSNYWKDEKVPSSFGSWLPSALLRDQAGRLWVGTLDAGLELMEKPGVFTHHRHDPNNANGISHNRVSSLAEDKNGRIWVGTYGGGVNVYDPATGAFQRYRHDPAQANGIGSDLVTYVRVDRAGTVWIGTDGAGLQHVDAATGKFSAFVHDARDPGSLVQDVVGTLYEDRQGQLWVGTFLGGVDMLRRPRHPFHYFRHQPNDPSSLSESSVGCFLEDVSGTIWIGMERGWLNRYDRNTRTFSHYRFPIGMPGGNALLALHQDRKGRIWVGSYRGGLARFDPATGRFTTYRRKESDPKTLSDDEVWTIAEDEHGILWLGTNGGVDAFNPETEQVIAHHDTFGAAGSSLSGVRALRFDRTGNLWVGTLGGLRVLRRGTSRLVGYLHDDHDPYSLSHDSVVGLLEDSKGRLWVSTYGGGINLLNAASSSFTTYKQFPSNVVYRMEEDSEGSLWISSNHGLCRFDPASGKVESYDLANGLQSLQFSMGASLKIRDGRLLFGSVDGFYEFDPKTIKPDTRVPPIVLTGLRRFNDPVKLPQTLASMDEVAFRHDDKAFTIEFAALDFSFPRRNRYAYKLEGFSDKWVELGARREVSFTNLDARTYVFHVKATNSDGIWNDASAAKLRIVVHPAFWNTWWFRFLAVGSVGVALVAGHRVRVRRLTADLEQRRQGEQALRAAEEKYRELVETINDIIFAADEMGRVTYISPVVEAALGYKPSEILGDAITKIVAPDDLAQVAPALREPGSVNVQPLEYRVVTKSRKLRWMRSSLRPILQGGRMVGVRGVLTDITERKKLEEQLRQSQKMEAIGQLAGGVAHDFNNLLTGILSYSELLLEEPGLTPEARAGLNEIRTAGERAAALTRQLLAFSRRQVFQPKVVDLNRLVFDMEKMLHRLIGEDIHLVISLGAGLGRVKIDPSQTEQILMNLAINSRDAMPRGGNLIIETANVTLDETYTRQHVAVQPGEYVRLAVSDTGCGMDAETQAHLFEPFFTTKGVGKGTGLGLSTVYGIVKQSAGHISVYSEVGVGTTFKIYLPCVVDAESKAAGAVDPKPAVQHELPHGSGTVLLVEDNEGVRKITRQVLQQSGYTVVEAADGEGALKRSAEYHAAIDLLLTDVIMPGINGREVAERLSAARPGMKVLYMSGYTDDAILRHGGLTDGSPVIEKPFTPDALRRKVHEVLHETAGSGRSRSGF